MPIGLGVASQLTSRNKTDSQTKQTSFGEKFEFDITKPLAPQLTTYRKDDIHQIKKIRSYLNEDQEPKSSFTKLALELCMTAMVTATALWGIKNGFDYTQQKLKEFGKAITQVIKSPTIKKLGSGIKQSIVNTGNKIDDSISSRAKKPDAKVFKALDSALGKVKSFAKSTYQHASSLFHKAASTGAAKAITGNNAKKAAEIALVEVPKYAASGCAATYAGLSALENVIDPIADEISPDKLPRH